jgi:hypothetical protein
MSLRAQRACLHAEVLNWIRKLRSWRYGTQAWQSDEVVARAKPIATLWVPLL